MAIPRGRWQREHRSSSRSFGGRGRGGSRVVVMPRPPSPPPSDLGEKIRTLLSSDFDIPSKNDVRIYDVEYVASYNWISGKSQPTIAVPGSPPKWCPPTQPPALKQDSGEYFRDPNAASFPTFPLQPTIESILSMNPEFQFSAIDICSCASSLGKLFRFFTGEKKSFRIAMELIGDTVYFNRREKSATELIPDVHGYGHTMPEAYTTWNPDVKRSLTHQRILNYKLGDLNCLVRFEVDGYIEENLGKTVDGNEGGVSLLQKPEDDTPLDEILKGTNLNLRPSVSTGDISVEQAGSEVPQSALFDLKTRMSPRKHEDFFEEFSSRLWLTQLSTFILGFHDWGVFNDIRIRNIEKELETWEHENQVTIAKFYNLLKLLVKMVVDEPAGELELWRYNDGPLEIRHVGGDFRGTLPPELAMRVI